MFNYFNNNTKSFTVLSRTVWQKLKEHSKNNLLKPDCLYWSYERVNTAINAHFSNPRVIFCNSAYPLNPLVLSILRTKSNSFYMLLNIIYQRCTKRVWKAMNCSTGATAAIKEFCITNERENVLCKQEIFISSRTNWMYDTQKSSRNILFAVMPLYKSNLYQFIKTANDLSQPLPSLNFRLNLIQQTIIALQFLHKDGIAHKDIRLAHIFMRENNCSEIEIRLGDFGESRFYNSNKNNIFHNLVEQTTAYNTDVKDFLTYVFPNILLWVSEDTCDEDHENILDNQLKLFATQPSLFVNHFGSYNVLNRIYSHVNFLLNKQLNEAASLFITRQNNFSF